MLIMLMDYLKLAASIIICLSAGFIGSFFTRNSISTWYTTIAKPAFNPPNWVFGPVWTILFILMGISLYLVWTSGKDIQAAVAVFAVQLVLNLAWSIIFFGLKSPMWAFGEILFLWVFIILTIIRFYPISKAASYLLVPYILWVSFAAILNFSIWMKN